MLNSEDTLNDILANSRMAVNYSIYVPSVMGCVILSLIYSMANTLMGYIFQWIWIILACASYYKLRKTSKKIKEYRKNGS